MLQRKLSLLENQKSAILKGMNSPEETVNIARLAVMNAEKAEAAATLAAEKAYDAANLAREKASAAGKPLPAWPKSATALAQKAQKASQALMTTSQKLKDLETNLPRAKEETQAKRQQIETRIIQTRTQVASVDSEKARLSALADAEARDKLEAERVAKARKALERELASEKTGKKKKG
jgi:hypothetical protein